MRKALGQRVRDLRKERGWSQEELAQKVGLTRQQVYRIESGETGTRFGTLERLAAVLGVPLSTLVSEDGVPTSPTEGLDERQVPASYLRDYPWLRRLRPDLRQDMLPVIDAGLVERVWFRGAPDGGFAALTDAQLEVVCESLVDHHRREEELRRKLMGQEERP
ncbi:MAG: helix-turn-helix transcriptional regulator [Bacteroidota bacterium]